MIGVYKIVSPTGRVYVGSSKNISKRIRHYKSLDCKEQPKLYNSLKKHGFEAHVFSICELCSIDDLYRLENYYGMLYCVLDKELGLNLSLPSGVENKNIVSEETRAKMSERQKGAGNNFYGKKHSPESLLKLKQGQSNRSAEVRDNMRRAQLGKKASMLSRKKMSLSQTGRNHSLDTKEKMSLTNCKSKWVLNTLNGVFYENTRIAAIYNDINRHTLKNMLNGSKTNKTNLIYA